MTTTLLDTLRRAELDQYFTNFSSSGITQLESLAQLSMQDYNSLGIISIQDRKKLFQLVQSLRQELPTKENGLVSSNAAQSVYRRQSRPTATGIVSSPAIPTSSSFLDSPSASIGSPISSNAIASAMPDLSTLSMSRRPVSNNGSPHFQSATLSTTPPLYPQQHQQQQQQQQQQQHQQQQHQQQSSATSTVTRSRSRTLPDQHQRPDFMKSMKATHLASPSVDSSDEEEEMPEIRRSSNPLLSPYGVPIQNSNNTTKLRPPFSQQQQSPPSLQKSPLVPASGLANSSQLGQSDLNQKIRVCVRKRPLNRKELERGEKDISPTAGIRSINVNEPKMKVDLTKYIEQHSFTFDDVFDVDNSNDQIYQRTAQPLVKYVFNGGKATCFAYGQTGSGKTYTMLDPQHGLYVLAARDVFSLLCQAQYQHLSAYIGFYEIYQGQLYDLLNNRKKLFAREDGKQNVVIVGLKEYVIKNVDDLMKVFEYGSQCRSTGSTGANSDSSRSHAILQILLKPTKNRKTITGKLSFIDLAGSERGADRGETDVKTRMEGAEINKSLLALKECIRALDQDKRHTPFRQSKLTQVLKDSFVGHSRTCMIATISPNQSNSEHTLNTLRYADRVKELKGERDRRGLGDNVASSTRNRAGASTQEDDDVDGYADGLMADKDHRQHGTYGRRNGADGYDDYGGYSDDPDLYHADDDDLFLGDEDFPSDGDVHILDKDFPHETALLDNCSSNNDDEQDNSGISSTTLLRQRYFDDDDDDDTFSSSMPKRQPTPYHLAQSSTNSTAITSSSTSSTTAGGLVQHRSMTMPTSAQQQNTTELDNQHQLDFNLSVSPPINNDSDLTITRSRQSSSDRRASMDRSSINTYTSRTSHSSPRQYFQQPQTHSHYQQSPVHHPQSHQHSTPFDDTSNVLDVQAMEEFIKFHRAEIRETSECSKKETKLLTHFSLNMASRKEDDYHQSSYPMDTNLNSNNERLARQQEDADKTASDFHAYLNNLDEMLEMKMAAIDALRDRIRLMLGEDNDDDY